MGQSLREFDQELYQRIDEVVHYIWDPIGVSSEPAARDEYYSYLPQIFQLVKSGDAAGIETYLKYISVERMGLSEDPESIKSTTEILLEWKTYLESQSHP
ncbi:MAG TPA: hypothetical protein PKO15_11565 [Fibrobacteria bacterium]|nr:hypothetical protein [Fibrobacteria bacterium]